MTLKQGQVITHKDGSKRKILAGVGEVVFPSMENDFKRAYAAYTEPELRALGYTWEEEQWTPEKGERYWSAYLSDGALIVTNYTWNEPASDVKYRDGFFGIFRTEAEALARIKFIEDKVKG
jgi:hypothetical protein